MGRGNAKRVAVLGALVGLLAWAGLGVLHDAVIRTAQNEGTPWQVILVGLLIGTLIAIGVLGTTRPVAAVAAGVLVLLLVWGLTQPTGWGRSTASGELAWTTAAAFAVRALWPARRDRRAFR